VAELRRLLIEPVRLQTNIGIDNVLPLSRHETHYLKRVLRLRCGDAISIVDGAGHLWNATVNVEDSLRLDSPLDSPIQEKICPRPLIGLAIALPKRGFDEFLRMSCEVGVDVVQPLSSDRCVVKVDGSDRSKRRESIICEATEQSERLWKPELRSIIDVRSWLMERPENAMFAIATTRLASSIDCQVWMSGLNTNIDQIWIAIGPEGGWTKDEHLFARKNGCISVQFGESILRTSTAAVVATQLMVDWRRNCSRYVQ
tara:strand:+ start:5392 stop:6162 length:771 start_codon:yes stop_codon:yes gene_type:complete